MTTSPGNVATSDAVGALTTAEPYDSPAIYDSNAAYDSAQSGGLVSVSDSASAFVSVSDF